MFNDVCKHASTLEMVPCSIYTPQKPRVKATDIHTFGTPSHHVSARIPDEVGEFREVACRPDMFGQVNHPPGGRLKL